MFGDMGFKQWVVIEIFVAGKKLITNIHKQLKKICTTSMLLITTLLVNRLHELQVLRKAKQRSVSWPVNNSSHTGVASMH